MIRKFEFEYVYLKGYQLTLTQIQHNYQLIGTTFPVISARSIVNSTQRMWEVSCQLYSTFLYFMKSIFLRWMTESSQRCIKERLPGDTANYIGIKNTYENA